MRSPLSVVFPRICAGCRNILETFGLCHRCWVHLDFITPPFCVQCGSPFSFEGYAHLCWSCRKSSPIFDSHRSLLRYGALSRKLIFALKHGRDRTLVPLLSHWLVPMVLRFPVDLIMPVPLHWSRLSYRCFNQSSLVAQQLGQLVAMPVLLNTLQRTRKTPSQGRLSRTLREENMAGAFRLRQPLIGRHVLLIDDVYTTGATLSACSHTLKEAGVASVHSITLAKVIFHNKEMEDTTQASSLERENL